jgi:hypothetical protein
MLRAKRVIVALISAVVTFVILKEISRIVRDYGGKDFKVDDKSKRHR